MMQEARPHLSTVFSSAHEDFKTLLSDGSKLADFKIKRQDFTLERHSIYVKEGLLGFFSATSKGIRSGFVYHAAAFAPCCRRMAGVVAAYRRRAQSF